MVETTKEWRWHQKGKGDVQTSCLWTYLVDLAHSYNWLSVRENPARPAQESGSPRAVVHPHSHTGDLYLAVCSVKVTAAVLAASTLQEAQFQEPGGF